MRLLRRIDGERPRNGFVAGSADRGGGKGRVPGQGCSLVDAARAEHISTHPAVVLGGGGIGGDVCVGVRGTGAVACDLVNYPRGKREIIDHSKGN